ncbi:WD40 repeat-containing protein [Nitzschia inconspicua]|uniref:WD40 repeat-containing protein n=1 Tax=Nitzschia inconspicua TaxID=303405 RepID=A0A9K3KPG8_9STRA|nr:WD40 repeat-containing protein [Nitzschia inconspicua]
MRSWISNWKTEDKSVANNAVEAPVGASASSNGAGSGSGQGGQNQQQQQPQQISSRSTFGLAAADAFSNLARRGIGTQDAEIERKVSLSARNLCYGVQRIVVAAKGKSGAEWKTELLTLLGGSDEESPAGSGADGVPSHSDLDVLLVAPKSEKFVQRCLENELPPNMIHCLRLLRVLELQHASQTYQKNEAQGRSELPIKPIASRATGKVSQLLCTLCTDPSVGEQLRPHLFGLLALSGASYPASGVHVAKAASQVIIAFSEHCLSTSLVWFLHDRKMIIHMTDDIKELCGQTAGDGNRQTSDSNQSGNSHTLYGTDAEAAGLWAISLSTVVHLVVNSCRHDCRELLKDFEAADGNQVLKRAIMESKSMYGKKLTELLPFLASCRTNEKGDTDSEEIALMVDPNHNKMASNPAAFKIMEDLLYETNPMLRSYMSENGKKPDLSTEQAVREMSGYSLRTAVRDRFGASEGSNETGSDSKTFDVATDLLLAALQLYSEHFRNYDVLEDQCKFLTLYILSFPTISDENLKVLILKTIEFVITGITGSKALQPFSVLSEVFVSICKSLLEEGMKSGDDFRKAAVMEGLFADTGLINESLEKLFRFDGKVGPQIMQSGKITTMVDNIAQMLLHELKEKKNIWLVSYVDDEGKTVVEPPSSTPFDSVCAAILKVLSLIMGYQAKRNAPLLSAKSNGDKDRDINYLLHSAIKELGDEAADAASSVFEAIMVSRENLELLCEDLGFCFGIVDHFSNIIAQTCGIPVVAKKIAAAKSLQRATIEELTFAPSREVSIVAIRRVSSILTMIKRVLEFSNLAREAFRLSGGFENLVKIVLSLGGSALQDEAVDDVFPSLMRLFQNLLSVVDASVGHNARHEPATAELGALIPISLSRNELVDPVSSQHGPFMPSSSNLHYLRLNVFYLDFAIAISQTKVMKDPENAAQVLELAMSHIDPSFSLTKIDLEKDYKTQLMRNPDAVRLILGLVLFLPSSEEGHALAKRAFDQVIRLCDPSRLGSTLSQIAKSGMVWSITNPNEFAPILDDTTHPLYPRFTLLLRRIAAFSMSYSDFVSVIRAIVGPLLTDDRFDSRIRLPVISSSIRQRLSKHFDGMTSDAFQERENDFCRRLESLCSIAERGERVAYCIMGGDSINTLSVLLHKTKVEDRLYQAADGGRLNFLEVDCLDLTSHKPGGFLSAGVAAPGSSGGERLWTPMATSGFSFSMWFRFSRAQDDNREGNLYLFDLSNPTISTSDGAHTPQSAVFLSVWYDLQAQRFNIVSSTSHRGEPICFPVSPLMPGVWHHVLVTYTPTKRTMMGRKSVIAMYVDGRPLEAEIKIDSVNIAPNARVLIGAPNAIVSASGIVRGMIPTWDLGPTILLSTVLMELDATAIFIYGPDFEGLFWGDRPQRLSLSATGTAAFALLAETGEPGSVASALRRRDIARLEAAGTVSRELGLGGSNDDDNDSLGSLGLLCTIPPDCLVFAYRAGTINPHFSRKTDDASSSRRRNWTKRLVNIARLNSSNELVSSDASLFGKAGIVNPRCFEDNVQWAGGPHILMLLVYAALSARSLALALRLFRASTVRHPPNLEAMQSGGGFQILAVLIQGKKFVDQKVLEQAFAFAVHGFVPPTNEESESSTGISHIPLSTNWVFSDLDAMKQLLLNHQVWDLKNSGPELPLRLVTLLNGLVGQKSVHKAFNSRRLHLVGVIRWTLHLMVEAADLYTAGDVSSRTPHARTRSNSSDTVDLNDFHKSSAPTWHVEAPNVFAVSVGGDPDNPLLHCCKALLRRVLTFMLTPGDLDAIAEATMYTVSVGSFNAKTNLVDKQKTQVFEPEPEKLLPGAVTRVYLLRLIEELIVDGVNEIVASAEKKGEGEAGSVPAASHAGGIANPNQAYFSTAILGGRIAEGEVHPKHQQAQNFLAAFGSVFTPVWFAALLEGCHEEASASAVLRLMILMLQSSPSFAMAFQAQGGFAPLVLSIPKFSTCPTVILALLSELLHVSILHLPSLPILDAAQLNEVFTSESEVSEIVFQAYMDLNIDQSDSSSGVFALLAECIGRNVQLAPFDNELGKKARETNMAILELLAHRHSLSPAFQGFCRTPGFIEPLSQTLCMVYDERSQRLQNHKDNSAARSDSTDSRLSRKGSLNEIPQHLTPAERFVGRSEEFGSDAGAAMVELLRMILLNSVVNGPVAPPLVYSLFSSFPVHATPEQVGAFQLLLIDLIKSTVEDAVEMGEATALATSVGLCSVLLDKLMKGFFTSELILHTVSLTLFLLKGVTMPDSMASRNTSNSDLLMITADAAHIARLACLCGLKRSRPMNANDLGDPELQDALIQMTAKRINELMIVPKSSGLRRSATLQPPPSIGSKSYPLWLAASISRCSPGHPKVLYPDLSETEEPLRLFIVGLMTEISVLLKDERDEIREAAVVAIVGLLQHRRAIMSGLLIKEIETTDNRVETIDVMNRGGFGALLVAHEVAQASGSSSGKKNYTSFFEWYEKHATRVQIVFDDIEAESTRIFPGLTMGTETADEAVEIEQQTMAMKLASQETSDRTIIGGLERAELAQRCIDRTGESHFHWKRQGFDDLASGAMRWKFLLRRLKGSCSVWEGGPRPSARSIYSRHQQLYSTFNGDFSLIVVAKDTEEEGKGREIVTRWKLDMTEGHERQRRRLLPNYEFHGLYNIDEAHDDDGKQKKEEASDSDTKRGRRSMVVSDHSTTGNDSTTEFFVGGSGMEATAELLKELNITKVHHSNSEDIYDYDADDDIQTDATTATGSISDVDEAVNSIQPDSTNEAHVGTEQAEAAGVDGQADAENLASSYELITGLLHPGDWPEQSYNVRRCTGLEVRNALLLWCRDSIYIIDGFEQSGEGLDGRITRVEKEESSFNINLRPKDFKATDELTPEFGSEVLEDVKSSEKSKQTKKTDPEASNNEVTYQHRSQRISFAELHSVFRRRYQLQQIALEFYDIHHNGTLVAFATNEEREEVLSKVLAAPLPNSIFSSFMGTSINYRKFMSTWKSRIVSQWVNGKMTNFEFLMHLNSFAGRTYNDLTQYPVFPWVIADYESEELDLNDPKTFRDLSKPMGALGPDRAQQFKERYESLEASYTSEDDPPPFHYGTHYSCAAYVLYYLMRLEPFSRLALSLQGGRFDVADRLFHNIGSSWKSASEENLQDVRELIPEFFYLPNFLTNTNGFDFGITQKGKHVHDVTLPKWAKGDPARFVRLNRQALESDYVSKNLHLWIDLIFGYKQRGAEAVEALNTFVHVTYEGEVDLESMTDPVQRESTIAQIQNFGQTPSRLERRPFQQRIVFSALKDNDKAIDFGTLPYLAPLTPPFCVVGAPQRCQVRRYSTEICKAGMSGQADRSVGDLCLIKGQLIGVGRNCTLNIGARTYYRGGGPNYGLSVHVASLTARNRELNKLLSVHDGLHRAEVSVVKPSLDGQWVVTGSIDSTVRLWKYTSPTMKLCATFCGHDGWKITCIDISTVFGVIVTGCAQGRVILWDLRTLTFVRALRHRFKDESTNAGKRVFGATSVSINHKTGNIITLIGPYISVFDINGNLMGTENSLGARPSCAIATDCPEWQEEGILAITGHVNGEVRFWSLDYPTQEMTVRYLMVDQEHTTEITALRASGIERQDTLLVGDKSGKMSICRTVQIENFSTKEITEVIAEIRASKGMDPVSETL